MSNIFLENAPRHWAAGLPVIPLKPNSKAAIPVGWSSYSTEMPPEEVRASWITSYPNGNMGLVLGDAAGVCALDIDTDDPRVLKFLDAVLPPSPWHRRGKKGEVRLYKFAGHRTFRIHTVEGGAVLELLSTGTQVVLPPSIHPDTMMPYVANCDITEVLDKLNPLPANVEDMIRAGLIELGIDLSIRGSTKVTEWVAAGARDSTMVSMAGLYARAVLRGERTIREAFSEMQAWIDNLVEKVAGDDIDAQKGATKIVEFIRRDIIERGMAMPAGWDADLDPEEREKLAKEFGEDFEEWTTDKILTWIGEQFAELDQEDPARNRVVDDALIRFSKQKSPNALDEERLYRFINDATFKQVPIAGMRRRLADLRRGEKEGQDHAEIAQLVMKEMQKYGEIRWENDQFYQWAGSHWRVLSERDIIKVIAEDYGNLPAARRASDHRGILQTAAHIVKQGVADVDIEGLNFANGFLDTSGTLRDHHPKYGARYVLPYRYVEALDGACPRFLSFLADSWEGDDDYGEKVQAVREAIGATLFGQAYKFSRAICLFGVPASGKSTLMKIVQGLVPEGSMCQVAPTDWGDRFLPAGMDGKLLNACGELSETHNVPGDRFKQIVEGDEITAQHKGRQPFIFRPTCGQWFCTNHLPKTRDTSAGFNRRWLFLEFRKQVTAAKRVRGLDLEILAEEREAIVAWAVAGYFNLKGQTDYSLPSSHVELVSEIANQNNSVRYFFAEGGVRREPSAHTSEQTLYEHYWAFCNAVAHVKPVMLKKFRLMARELQREFGFEIITDVASGIQTARYEYITLAAPKG